MKLDQLTYFLETAKHEHIGKASKTLGISAGAISHSISALEEEFGRALFVKHGKRIQLTEHGKVLVERARQLLQNAEHLREELSAETCELRGHFRLAASHGLCPRILTPAWSQLQNANPLLTAEIYTLRSSQVAQGIIQGEYDLGVCFNPQANIALGTESLSKGQLVITFRKNHPYFRRKNRITEVSKYPATLPKAFQGIDVCQKHAVFEKFGIEVKTDCLIDSYDVAIQKLFTSNAWSLLPDVLVQATKGLKAVSTPSGWDAEYQIAAVWPKERVLSRPMRQLLDHLKLEVQATTKVS